MSIIILINPNDFIRVIIKVKVIIILSLLGLINARPYVQMKRKGEITGE